MSYAPVGPEKCPRCGAESPLVDWNEVDIGVGTQCFDYQYECPTHGVFCFQADLLGGTVPRGAIFRDDGP